MQNLIKENLGILLKSIVYENVLVSDNKKIDCNDKIEKVAITSDIAEFEIARNVSVDLQNAYNLKIIVRVQLYAKENVDLKKKLTDAFIEQNKDNISGTVMTYMSALITQITASFNGYPIITAPALQN